jgi:hypothetical protein
MEFNRESIANFIYDLLKFEKVCKADLDYAFDVFLKNEEYEKCSVVKEMIELRYYDNRKRKNNEELLKIEKLINSLSSGDIFLEKKEFMKQRERINKLKEEIESFYYMMERASKEQMVLPPFKNVKNKYYFYNI